MWFFFLFYLPPKNLNFSSSFFYFFLLITKTMIDSENPKNLQSLTFSPRSMYLTATSSLVTLSLISLATPKFPDPMSRTRSYRSLSCMIGISIPAPPGVAAAGVGSIAKTTTTTTTTKNRAPRFFSQLRAITLENAKTTVDEWLFPIGEVLWVIGVWRYGEKRGLRLLRWREGGNFLTDENENENEWGSKRRRFLVYCVRDGMTPAEVVAS